ncbi:MAG: L-type lectin-domain containing protein [Candidatus Acidiferrum sp.]
MRLFRMFPRKITSILAVVIFLCLGGRRANAQQTFSYSDFSSTAGLQLNGRAAPVVNGNGLTVLRLTPNTPGVPSSAWYTNPANSVELPVPLPLANGFSTTFTFQITAPAGIGSADGIAFVVQNDPTGTSALGGGGGGIGFAGLTESFAIEFDTFCNGGDICTPAGTPNAKYSSADELSVNSCGPNANTSDHTVLGGPNGVTCTFGAVDLSVLKSPIYLADGNFHTAQITYVPPATYDGSCPPGSALGIAACGSLTIILDGQSALTVPFSTGYLGLDANSDAFVGFTAGTGAGYQNQDIVSWSFGENVVTVVSQPINTTTPPDLVVTFNSTPGNIVQEEIDFRTAGAGITSPIANPVLLSINRTLSQTNAWSQYVAGTPWAVSLCTIKAGNGGTDLCSLYVNACYDSTLGPATATDANCPTVNDPNYENYVTLKDTFDWKPGEKIQPLPGTTFSLIDFTPATGTPNEMWNPSATSPNPVCTNVSATLNASTTPPTTTPNQCDISDSLVDIYGDQTTTRGGKPKKGWLISVYNVPMPTTTVEAAPNPNDPRCPLKTAVVLNNSSSTVWSNGACLLDFVVNPAVPPTNFNGYQAAPPASLLYGAGTPAVQPGPPPEGDNVVFNPNPALTCHPPEPCFASPWDTGVNIPLSTFGGEGSHTIHWSSKDTVGIGEKNVQLIPTGPSTACHNPDNDPNLAPPCYNTDYFTTSVNIDNTAPAISAAFSTPGSPAGLFALNQVVYPVYTCSDALSGVAACGGQPVASCPLAPPAFTSTTALNTSTPGVHSYNVTATDCAGNTSQPLTVSYKVASPADVAIFEQRTSDYPLHGTNLTYIAWALDLSKTSAFGVTITFQIPAPAGIVGGPITGTVADVSCTLFGCSAMPPSGGSACSVTSNNTVTCYVGPLASLWTLHGAVAKITVPIASTAKPGSTFKIIATVTSDNDPNASNNITTDTITVK